MFRTDGPRDPRNWRANFTPAFRRSVVDNIYGIIMGLLPWANRIDARNLAIAFEDKVFETARTQLHFDTHIQRDYQQKINDRVFIIRRLQLPEAGPPPRAPSTPPRSPGRRYLFANESDEEEDDD